MNESFLMDGKTYLSVKAAGSVSSYSRDHITRLAKDKKVTAMQVGRKWFVGEESLRSYVQTQGAESEIRNKHLRQVRQREIALRTSMVSGESVLSSFANKSGGRVFVLSTALLCLSAFLGSQLVGADVKGVGQFASALSADQPETSIDNRSEEVVLAPVFRSEGNSVAIDSKRVVTKPNLEDSWLEIYP